MDDDRGPQYWRGIASMAACVVLLGYALIFWGGQQAKAHQDDPPASSPNDTCVMNGQQMPCGILPNNGVDMTDEQGHSVRPPTEPAGSGLVGFGIFVMIVGLIPAWIAGANLRRIRNATIDYTYNRCSPNSTKAKVARKYRVRSADT